MILNNDNGLTVKELKEFIKNSDDEGEIWIETGKGLTSPVIEIITLNKNDICLRSNTFKEKQNVKR